MPYRVRAQSENGLNMARFLQRHPSVEVVHYPGLPEHPGHRIAARQMSAFGGMLSFQVRGGQEAAMGVVARCRLFIRATSLGGAHSLVEHRASVEGPGSRTPQNLIRLSIGLEHVDDLTEDLNQAQLCRTIIPVPTLGFPKGMPDRTFGPIARDGKTFDIMQV